MVAKELKALKILQEISNYEPDTRKQKNNIDINFTIHDFTNINKAIKELKEFDTDRDSIQKLFINQELKYKREIKELKVKFIEDISFLKKDM